MPTAVWNPSAQTSAPQLPSPTMVPQIPVPASPVQATPPQSPAPTSQNTPSPVSAIQQAIGHFESQGNYNAIGKPTASGDRAYGKYQVMGSNIPSWTKAATGTAMTPQQFLQSPQAQDAVASHQMSQLYAQYKNPADVASAWFSGKPLAAAGNEQDVNGTTVPAYVEAILKLLGGGTAYAATLPQSSGSSPSSAASPSSQPSQPSQPATPQYPGMPPMAHFSLPTPGQASTAPAASTGQQQPQYPGMPPMAQFSLPQSAQAAPTSQSSFPVPSQPFSTPLSDIASGNGANGAQRGIGALKGIGQVMSQVGGTSGGNPVVNAMLANAPGFNKDVQALNSAVQPSNFSQSQGAAESNIGAGLITPGGQAASDVAAATKSGIPDVAKAIASEKPTLGNVVKQLLSMGEGSGTAKDAKAIEPMVENGTLKAGNSAKTALSNISALKNSIVDTAQGLMSRLQSMDVKPTLQPEDLTNILKQQMTTIEKNLPPSQQETAKATAQWLWQKFVNNLPKGQDITPDVALRARQITDQEISQIKGDNVFDPATENGYTVALRALRQGVNDWVSTNAPDQAVQAALSHQTSLYNVLENVATKGAPAIKKANELANMPGISGLILRHPYTVGAAATAGLTALEGAGLGLGARYLGGFTSPPTSSSQ